MNKFLFTAVFLTTLSTGAIAQNCTTNFSGNYAYTNCYGGQTPDPYAAGIANINRIGGIIAQQRQTEAIVNAYRQAHGLPRCSTALFQQWAGTPAC